MIVLIQDPGSICSLQAHLQCYPNVYKDATISTSDIDGVTTVLDVRLPIRAPNIILQSPYRVVEGHTRCYEAACRGVGIEAYLATTLDDLLHAPHECFVTLSKEQCAHIYSHLDAFQDRTIEEGVQYIRDLIRKKK